MRNKHFKNTVNKIKEDRKKSLLYLSKGNFGTRQHMLFVLQTCYQNILDRAAVDQSKKRLSLKEEFELGQNLAKYWSFKL